MNFRSNISSVEKEIEELKTKIKENLFRVQLKSRDIRTREEIEQYGTYVSGEKSIDDYAGDEVRTIYITIENMIEYYKRGVVIYIPRQEDTDNIYKLIDTYLRTWKSKLEGSFHPGNAPIEDLISYETFAQTMFGVAKYSISVTKPFISPFVESLNALPIQPKIGDSLRNINFKRINPIVEEVQERPDLDTFFKSRVIPLAVKKRFR